MTDHTDIACARTDAHDYVRDCIELVAALNVGRNDDALTDAIRTLEDVQGKLWIASARAEEAASFETMRQTASDLAAYQQSVI